MRRADRQGKAARRWDVAWLLLCGLASSAWCVSAAQRLGPTYDEPGYLEAGLRYWRTGNHRDQVAGGGTMPLPVDACTLPLHVWECWTDEPLDLRADLARVLPVARAAMLGFWCLLLLYGWRTGRRLAGPWGGRLAVALLACEPVLLGHAALATADVALSACLLALVFHYQAGREARWCGRVIIPAFWFGMTCLAKASGPAFGAVCLLIVQMEYLLNVGALRLPVGTASSSWLAPLGRSVRDLVLVSAGGVFLAAFYCGDDRDPARPVTSGQGGAGSVGHGLDWLAGRVRSMSNAYHGVQFQLRRNREGQDGVFLLGRARRGAFWYYFPVALTIKLTLSLLSLPFLVAVVRPRALLNAACLAAVALLALTLACKVQLGVRVVLPVVVFLVVGVAAGLARALDTGAAPWQKRLLACSAAGAVVWSAVAAGSVWPHGLCYTNELWGGTAAGYRHLSDSNYDWGQGLPDLVRWQQRHHPASMDVWYFGTDPALFRLPLRELSWTALAAAGSDHLRAQLRGRFFAASTTMLYGAGFDNPAARFLRACRPVARTRTFLIYDFTR